MLEIPDYHDFTWMPNYPSDCPCSECQDFIDFQDQHERTQMWSYVDNWNIQITDSGRGECVCGLPIETYDSTLNKELYIKAVKHVLVQVFGLVDLGDGVPFTSVSRVRVHPECVLKTRPDLDMENHAKSVLILEDLPPRAKIRLGKLYSPTATVAAAPQADV